MFAFIILLNHRNQSTKSILGGMLRVGARCSSEFANWGIPLSLRAVFLATHVRFLPILPSPFLPPRVKQSTRTSSIPPVSPRWTSLRSAFTQSICLHPPSPWTSFPSISLSRRFTSTRIARSRSVASRQKRSYRCWNRAFDEECLPSLPYLPRALCV